MAYRGRIQSHHMRVDEVMATEKLAEGIRNFVADQVKLEQLIGSQ